jgi:hypothetical protein
MSTIKHASLYDWLRGFLVLLLIALLLPSSSAQAQGSTGSSRWEAAAKLGLTPLSEKTVPEGDLSSSELTTNLLLDGGFEAYDYNNHNDPDPYWYEWDSYWLTPICNNSTSDCGNWGDAHPHTGNNWLWFGMIPLPSHDAYVEQSVNFPNSCGKATLSFYFWIGYAQPGSGTNDIFRASIDGTPVFTAYGSQASTYSSYRLITVDLGAYASGAAHTLRFSNNTTDQDVGFQVDDVSINWTTCPVISGTAGIGGASLSYVDGTPKTVTADASGNYSFMVPYNWSGTVTPSKTGFTFSPTGIPYSNLTTDQPNQNYTASWVGGISISSDRNIVAVGRPHVGAEVASYDGFKQGSLTSYVPMLFKNAYGSYNSALYVQNVDSSNTANITVKYYDSDGLLKCTRTDTISPLASKGYWMPTETCNSGSLPAGWVGGAVVTSDKPIVAVGRPHVGTEVMTYNGFTEGSLATYIPMLFKGAYGGSYNSAFYIQNVNDSLPASITIKYYDSAGLLQCTKADTIQPLASKGYWVPTATCDTGSIPAGWIGGVVVTSDQPIVGVGRPHIGTQVTTYNGFTGGGSNSYIPMLFKAAYGGSYNAAFYLQNTDETNPATITIKYYDNTGSLNCTKADTIQPLASKGYWLPSTACDTGALPTGWAGGVVVTSDKPIVGVGRPHIDAQVTTYNGFAAGGLNSYLPMLFKDAFGGSYDSAFYFQNTDALIATVTIKLYDTNGNLACTRQDTIPPLSTKGYWLPTIPCNP